MYYCASYLFELVTMETPNT